MRLLCGPHKAAMGAALIAKWRTFAMTDTPHHTPAPWLPGIRNGDVVPVIAGGVPIAEMIPTYCTEEEFTANCSLVYAAPALLAAVLSTLLALEEGGKLRDMPWKTLRAAAVQAIGEEAYRAWLAYDPDPEPACSEATSAEDSATNPQHTGRRS